MPMLLQRATSTGRRSITKTSTLEKVIGGVRIFQADERRLHWLPPDARVSCYCVRVCVYVYERERERENGRGWCCAAGTVNRLSDGQTARLVTHSLMHRRRQSSPANIH